MAVVNSNFELNIVSFNMKGFHQGFSVVSDLVEQCKPDSRSIGLLQTDCTCSISSFLGISLNLKVDLSDFVKRF